MGTKLQQYGITGEKYPELTAFNNPEVLRKIHSDYIAAGSDVIYTNTFGANRFKLEGSGRSPEEVIRENLKIAKECAGGKQLVALDIGPLGKLLEPMGSTSFEEAYDAFAQMVKAGVRYGADLIAAETLSDLYEAKAVLLAAKENSSLPVFVTMSFDESGRTFTGTGAKIAARTLTALGADAVGMNCSLGPDKAVKTIKEIADNTYLPVIAKPNAGLPDPLTGGFNMSPGDFADFMEKCTVAGASIVGGCCGTDERYIEKLRSRLAGRKPVTREYRHTTFFCSSSRALEADDVLTVGERINPTGKKELQKALAEENYDYILKLAVSQQNCGADMLDVNTGHPGTDEKTVLPEVIRRLQSSTDLPLQIDTSDPDALEKALRVYNGIPCVNSVNGKEESLGSILPLVKKYGACVVALTLDENGIPDYAADRIRIAEKILSRAKEYGIPEENVIVDCLTLTVSAQQEQAAETLNAVYEIHKKGLKTTLGVSNISFGLPERQKVTACFLAQALAMGLDMPIINPEQSVLRDTISAHKALNGKDPGCVSYIKTFSDSETASAPDEKTTLFSAIEKGLRDEARKLTELELTENQPDTVIRDVLIPALNSIGRRYEEGSAFLPQLLSAAAAAQEVFSVLKQAVPGKKSFAGTGAAAVATVHGDIHDIGKNIVRTVIENYGYEVHDLGKDVPPETVCDFVIKNNIKVVGLSALMTTTLPAMKETVRLLKEKAPDTVVWVGGAVVTPEYASSIGADYYAEDAGESVAIVKKELGL